MYVFCKVVETILLCSSTHEKKSKTNIVIKGNKFYLKHNSLADVSIQF